MNDYMLQMFGKSKKKKNSGSKDQNDFLKSLNISIGRALWLSP